VTYKAPRQPLICIVDDDDGVRAALDRLLRSADYRTMLCASAENALESETVYQIDCFVIDVDMPGGLHLHDILKAMHHPTPVIIVSARADDTRDRAHNSGAFAVIPKPFSQSDVLDAIRAALVSRGLQRP
jgi:FixJ family two-component response regulator